MSSDDFLRTLVKHGGAATHRQLGCVIDRKEDQIRQWCRRNGLVNYDRSVSPARWTLTEAGISRLRDIGY